jgi:hypothetical protein
MANKININPENKGKLRKALGAKKGKTLTVKELNEGIARADRMIKQGKKKQGETLKKRAVFAKNARKFKRG